MEYRCSCYFWRHVYVKRLGIHVEYKNREDFVSSYGKVSCDAVCRKLEGVELIN